MPESQKGNKLFIYILTTIILLSLVIGGGYYFYLHNNNLQNIADVNDSLSVDVTDTVSLPTLVAKDSLVDNQNTSNNSSLPLVSGDENHTTQEYNKLISQANSEFNTQQYEKSKQTFKLALQLKSDKEYPKRKIKEIDSIIYVANRKVFLANKIVFVQGGTFVMGSDIADKDEKPAHEVTVSSFYISRFEVTVSEYRDYCTQTGVPMPPMPKWGWIDDHPIVNVSWNDAMAYATWAGKRLPSEAEWEFAARGGLLSKGYAHSGSNTLDNVAWYLHNSAGSTQPIGTKRPNELGLYDMSGNVYEWCNDWYDKEYYTYSEPEDPTGPFFGDMKVMRGGSWYSEPKYMYLTYRNNGKDSYRYTHIGFRLAWSP